MISEKIIRSEFNISGGAFGEGFVASSGSEVNISGGIFADGFEANRSSIVNLLGTEFFLDGEPLENLILDQTTTVSERGENVILSGLLADGTSFDFALDDGFDFPGFNFYTSDHFASGSTLTVTLVAVPEPGSGLALATISILLLSSRRKKTLHS